MRNAVFVVLALIAVGTGSVYSQTFTLDGQGGTQPVPPIGQNPVADTLFQPVVALGFARFATPAATAFSGTGADSVDALTFGYDGQSEFGGAPVAISNIYFSVDRIAYGRVGTGSRTESIVGIQPPASDVSQASDVYFSALGGTHSVYIDDNGFLTGGASDHPAWLSNGNVIMGLGDSGDGILGNGVNNGESYNVTGLDMRNAVPGTGLGSIYYSVAGSSDILFGSIGNNYNAAPSTYATASQLGLQPGDDLTGLTIVDYDGVHTNFNVAQDYVYFSLARGSTSLNGDNQAGDIWLVGGGSATPDVVADEELLGFDVAPGGLVGFDLVLAPGEATADLSVSSTGSPNPLYDGSNVVYSIAVSNLGPAIAEGVVVTDTLPVSVVFDVAGSSPGCSETSGVVTCQVGDVAGNSSTTLVVSVFVEGILPADLTNHVVGTMSTVDANTGNETSTTVITIPDTDTDGEADFVDMDDDNDGLSDLEEAGTDTDPRSASSALRIAAVLATNSFLNITWEGGSLVTQYVERATSLTSVSWVRIFTNLPPTATVTNWTDPDGVTYPNVFYRISVP